MTFSNRNYPSLTITSSQKGSTIEKTSLQEFTFRIPLDIQIQIEKIARQLRQQRQMRQQEKREEQPEQMGSIARTPQTHAGSIPDKKYASLSFPKKSQTDG
jgi:hypothetical protein